MRNLVSFCVTVARAFGFRTGVLHIDAKSTSKGPRIVEINARMGGGPIHQIVGAVWGVDLIDLHAATGEQVMGPEAVFATSLAEVVVSGRDLRQARAVTAELLREPARTETTTTVVSPQRQG